MVGNDTLFYVFLPAFFRMTAQASWVLAVGKFFLTPKINAFLPLN